MQLQLIVIIIDKTQELPLSGEGIMSIGQLERSALRRALQTSFLEGIIAIMQNSHRRGKLSTRFSASWKWMLTLCSIRHQGFTLKNKKESMQVIATKLGIHSGQLPAQEHQKLFQITGISSISEDVLILGFEKISDEFLLGLIDKKYRKLIGNPWDYLLPEDIGSCYEMVKEIEAREIDGEIELVYSDGRRKSGIHHTPFDVIQHMADISLSKIEIDDDSIPEDLVICDLAVGAGAFLIQFARIISNITGQDVGLILDKHVIGFDIDSEVLQVCSLCFHLERGCPELVSSYHLHQVDTVGKINSREKVQQKIAEMMPASKGRSTITTGNPPYVRVKAKEYEELGLQSNKCGNLSAYFLERAIDTTEIGKVVCQIVPQSVVQSESMKPIRKILHSRCSDITQEVFDCVPGYMFDQGKIGSNSSTSITQRVAIITAITGEKRETTLKSTRFIRWGSQERNVLFENIETTEIPKELTVNFQFPMIGDNKTKEVFYKIRKSKRIMEELFGEKKNMVLFVPKAIRYFATASRCDLNRNQIEIKFENKEARNLAQLILNSSFFYWYWRIFGNGFQISNRDISQLPIPSEDKQKEYQKRIDTLSDRIHRNRFRLAVHKQNKGKISNIKYDNDPKLMRDIDKLVSDMFDLEIDFPFRAVKENSLEGYKIKMINQIHN